MNDHNDNKHKMSDKEMEIFVQNNPTAYKRFKRARRKKQTKKAFSFLTRIWKPISQIILWVCAVGGFVLSLIQFFQDK